MSRKLIASAVALFLIVSAITAQQKSQPQKSGAKGSTSVAAAPAPSSPWEVTDANDPNLKSVGRLVVNFPEGTESSYAGTQVFQPGAPKADDFTYGNASFEFMPGTYDVAIAQRRIAGVPIEAGRITRIRAGALHTAVGPQTKIQLYDPEKKPIIWGYGVHTYGLAEGTYYLRVQNGWKEILIKDGQTTEF